MSDEALASFGSMLQRFKHHDVPPETPPRRSPRTKTRSKPEEDALGNASDPGSPGENTMPVPASILSTPQSSGFTSTSTSSKKRKRASKTANDEVQTFQGMPEIPDRLAEDLDSQWMNE